MRTITIIVLTALSLSSCFTGIESTPRITESDVKRSATAQLPADDSSLAEIKPQHLQDWQPGKAFYVTNPKIGLALTLSPAGSTLHEADTLHYRSVTEVTSIMGRPVAQILFDGPRGITAIYRADVSVDRLSSLDGVNIPFTVELSVPQTARRLMKGHEYWITTSEWLDTRRQPRRGRKFVPVRVIDVVEGDDTYPVCLMLEDYTRQPADTFAIMMSVGDGIASSRRFQTMFALTDPHTRYPAITDATWAHIINGRVAEGMTHEEVRLSVGRPVNIDRRPGYGSLREIWTYENGTFLVFEDGLLKNLSL